MEIPRLVLSVVLPTFPVEDLVRCRAVSREWNRMITDPQFISEQFAVASLNPSLFLRVYYTLINLNRIHLLTENGEFFPNRILVLPPEVRNLDNWRIVGSVDGLICIDLSFRYHSGFALWNPATRHIRQLPEPSITATRTRIILSVYLGFGFDILHEDYKIVRIVTFVGLPNTFVEVYSWRNNLWRQLDGSVFHTAVLWGDDIGVFVEESLAWTGIGTRVFHRRDVIISFDMRTELFRVIQLDPPICGAGFLKVMSWRGFISVALCPGHNMNHFKFWVRMTGTWEPHCVDDEFPGNLDPLVMWKGLKLVVCLTNDAEYQPHVTLYNLDNRQVSNSMLPLDSNNVSLQAYNYVESLVPVDGRI